MEKIIYHHGKCFSLSDDKCQLQIEVIHDYLTHCYWSEGISKDLVVRAIDNSLCFGLYYCEEKTSNAASQWVQIGFARVTTDKSSFAYLADVFVLPEFSKRGFGTELMKFVMQHNDLQGLRRFMLCTRDAHRLYHKLGFTEVENPQIMMQISKPGLYTINKPLIK